MSCVTGPRRRGMHSMGTLATCPASIPTIYSTVQEMATRYVSKLQAYDDPSYCAMVEAVLNRHLVERYGRMCINDFSMVEASAIINRMRRTPYPNSVINVYCGHIRAAFESEYRNGRLLDNPWNHVHIPKREPLEKRALDEGEIGLLEEAFSHNALGDYFGFILHTGLKRTEASGVMAGNWQKETHQLAVNMHVDYSSLGRSRLKEDAYNGVARVIPLSPEAETCLVRALERQRALVQSSIPQHNSNNLVFATRTGNPPSVSDIGFNTHVVRTLTGIRDFSLGLLRSSFVVSRLREGVPVHVLQTYLGFKERETVLLYASFRSSGTEEAARALEGFFEEVAPREEELV